MLDFLGYVTLEKRRESHVRNLVKKCLSNCWPQFCMHYFNYNKDVLPRRKRSSGELRLPSIKLECTNKAFLKFMVVYFLIRSRFQRRIKGGGKGRVAMPPLGSFRTCLATHVYPFLIPKIILGVIM